jgi:hypothetical protein
MMLLMKTTPTALFDRIYCYTKEHGELGNSKYRAEWFLTLPNGVVIKATMEDAGYSHSISVAHLFHASIYYPADVEFHFGDKNGLLTIARMIGFQADY